MPSSDTLSLSPCTGDYCVLALALACVCVCCNAVGRRWRYRTRVERCMVVTDAYTYTPPQRSLLECALRCDAVRYVACRAAPLTAHVTCGVATHRTHTCADGLARIGRPAAFGVVPGGAVSVPSRPPVVGIAYGSKLCYRFLCDKRYTKIKINIEFRKRNKSNTNLSTAVNERIYCVPWYSYCTSRVVHRFSHCGALALRFRAATCPNSDHR